MSQKLRNIAAIVLAAGRGARMQSDKAKVLHEIRGRPMLAYVLDTAQMLADRGIVLVIGHQAAEVTRFVASRYSVILALQENPRGTAHAVMCAMPHVQPDVDDVLILYGDVPLLTCGTLEKLLHQHQNNMEDITLLAFTKDDPAAYGRVVFDGRGAVVDIVEEADADARQKAITTVNSGVYCVTRVVLESLLPAIGADNMQHEYYLTDIVGIGAKAGLRIGCFVTSDAREVSGINSISELHKAENYYCQLLQQNS